MKRNTALLVAATAVTAALALTGCTGGGSGTSSSGGSKNLTAVLWDPTQLPVYEKCAAEFKDKTGISVKYTQVSWNNYWQKLTTELSAGTAPDIFTDHVNYFAQYEQTGQLADLTPYFKKDGYKVDDSVASNKLWNVDGKQYAVSQDQDVEGLLYNTADIPSDTSAASLSQLTWNPTDGGTFQKMIEHLTVDDNGVRGDQPGFDKNHVKTYGFSVEGADATGQTSWSPFILSTGWYYTNKNPFGTKANYDDPVVAQTWDWLQKMFADGYILPVSRVSSLGEQPVLDQNLAAIMMQGSWEAAQRVPSYDKAQKFAWAQLPSGPVGHPVSITNSIGPSVTASSKNKANAAKYVEFVTSSDCANIVAKSGVEIPVDPTAAKTALATLQSQGVDTTHWQQMFDNPSWLKLFPITKNASQITAIGNATFANTLATGQGNPKTVLKQFNDKVNALIK
ncbi:extracellular solute-binding protein [Gryllotalpicola reticulitermitis]|uniref:Extracellular solute-binding protein n=1 Tax=Gryllotalpicola reticulitermitis TaxID=1184153 RepID=A0ABV8Q4Q1_9MICO